MPTDHRDTLTEATIADRGGQVYNVLAHGATRGGSNLGAKINDLVDLVTGTSPGGTILVPWGSYSLDEPILLRQNVSLVLDRRAVITAAQALPVMLHTDAADELQDATICGGQWMGNDLAQDVVWLRWTKGYHVSDMLIENYNSRGLVLGDTSAAFTGYETLVHRIRLHRRTGSVPVGSQGIHLENNTDCRVSQCVVIGAETGVRADTGGNDFALVHVWSRADIDPVLTCFDDNALGNSYTACYADTPHVYGWRLRDFNTRLIGCRHYNNPAGGLDNVAIGIRFDRSQPFATILGHVFVSGGASYRIARDLEFSDTTLGPKAITYVGTIFDSHVTVKHDERHHNWMQFSTGMTVGGQAFFNAGMTVSGSVDSDAATFNELNTSGSVNGSDFVSDGAAADGTRSWYLKTGGVLRARIGSDLDAETGSDAGSNVTFELFDDTGAFKVALIRMVRATNTLHLDGGKARLPGDWDKPTRIDEIRIWRDSTGQLRVKDSADPASETDGEILTRTHSGNTAGRPPTTNLPDGYMYFDDTLGKPIWWDAVAAQWVDATGAAA